MNAQAAPGAAVQCPGLNVGATNLAINRSFEGPLGATVTYPSPTWPTPAPSAARGWNVHTDNAGSQVTTRLVTTHAPGPNGATMLEVRNVGVESGVWQILPASTHKRMLTAWVFVVSGKVNIGINPWVTDPLSITSKTGEWEQLRVCTDGSVGSSTIYIWNQGVKGLFYVDRVELRDLP